MFEPSKSVSPDNIAPSRRYVLTIWMIGVFFVVAGANHFIHPFPYLSMMPRYLPQPSLLVSISGVAEILGGLGLMLIPTRRFAAWGLIALLVAVFPANVNVALHGWPGVNLPLWSLWLRLPLQLAFIYLVYHVVLSPASRERET